MKQIVRILFVLLALAILCGCAGPGRTGVTAPPEGESLTIRGSSEDPQDGPPSPQETSGQQTAQSRYEPETQDPDEEYCLEDLEKLLARPASPYAEHVFSHQGTMIEEPSETFAAYDLAVAYGSRFLEQDLVISADGVLYCSHDLTPEALTGEPRTFSEMNSAEIDALRTGSGQRLLRLSDVFARYGTAVTYVIELRYPYRTLTPFYQLIEEYGMAEHIIVQAPYLWELRQMEGVYPDMPKLLLVYQEEDFENAVEADCVDIVCVAGLLFDEESCARVHAAGKQYCVAVCNSTEDIRKAIDIGADYYFTDFTAKALMLEQMYRKPASGG